MKDGYTFADQKETCNMEKLVAELNACKGMISEMTAQCHFTDDEVTTTCPYSRDGVYRCAGADYSTLKCCDVVCSA